jgi:D-alanyl-D-alanine carboxypeptidase/D-alanyl-D-alanine-endopeptidase (penicillin-binding protein 4)
MVKYINKFIAFSAACLVAASAVAETQQQVVDAFVDDSTLSHASVGVAVVDVQAHQLVAGRNLDLSVITASTMKTITSSTALEMLGADYRFTTPVYLKGQVDGNKLKGDVIVVGKGDPTVGSRFFAGNANIVEEVINALKARGIKKIDGKVRIDKSLYPFPPFNVNWEVEDLAWDYGPGVHALNFSDNLIDVKFNRNDSTITDVNVTPNVPGFQVVNRLSNDSVVPFSILLEYQNPALLLCGYLKNGSHDFTIANPTPDVLLADSITRAIVTGGIKIKNKDVNFADMDSVATQLLVEHHSPVLSNIITSLLERSDNMFAESLLRAVALRAGKTPVDENGVAVVDSVWRSHGIDTRALFMDDGSGLARCGKASVRFMTDVLSDMATRRYDGSRLCDLMPRVGVNARIGSVIGSSNLNGKVAVKSGSMNNVQCFVGYYPYDEPQYTFAVLVNNYNCSRAELKNKIDRMLIGLFDEKK